MGNFNKWNRGEDFETDKLTVVLFVSRNKDNKDLEGFSERRKAFTTTRTYEEMKHQFEAFVQEGQEGEMSRMYVSVNPRSNSKTFRALQHKMLDEQFNLATLPQRIAALAALKENAYDSKHLNLLFDFDPIQGKDLEEILNEFVSDIQKHHLGTQTKKGETRPEMGIKTYKTPNGYAVVVDQRFDTRELLEKWSNVELKRDDLLCYAWGKK